jgi:hypothetical protein
LPSIRSSRWMWGSAARAEPPSSPSRQRARRPCFLSLSQQPTAFSTVSPSDILTFGIACALPFANVARAGTNRGQFSARRLETLSNSVKRVSAFIRAGIKDFGCFRRCQEVAGGSRVSLSGAEGYRFEPHRAYQSLDSPGNDPPGSRQGGHRRTVMHEGPAPLLQRRPPPSRRPPERSTSRTTWSWCGDSGRRKAPPGRALARPVVSGRPDRPHAARATACPTRRACGPAARPHEPEDHGFGEKAPAAVLRRKGNRSPRGPPSAAPAAGARRPSRSRLCTLL